MYLKITSTQTMTRTETFVLEIPEGLDVDALVQYLDTPELLDKKDNNDLQRLVIAHVRAEIPALKDAPLKEIHRFRPASYGVAIDEIDLTKEMPEL